MSTKLKILSLKFESLTLSNLTVRVGKKSLLINFKDPTFNRILREYQLDHKSYRALYELDRSMLKKLLNKKDLEVITLISNPPFIVDIKGAFDPDFLSANPLITASQGFISKYNAIRITSTFEDGMTYHLYYKAYDSKLSIVYRKDTLVTTGRVSIEKYIDDPIGIKSYILNSMEFDLDKLTKIKPTIQEVLKFRSLFPPDMEDKICESLQIKTVSQVRKDHSSIIIQNYDLMSSISSVLLDPYLLLNICKYYLTGKYSQYRSSYNKTIFV